MKTMKIGDSVIRVKEDLVDSHVSAGYKFVPKSEWKKLRDAGSSKKEKKEPVTEQKQTKHGKK
jgi:hypothetical protein